MFKKIINFIKYSNVFTVVLIIVFVAVASAMASNDNIKKNVIGEEIVEKTGVDNTLLLAEDLDNFDLEMKIIDVTEDLDSVVEVDLSENSEPKESVDLGNYYINYQYKTLAIQDDIWQEVLYKKQLVISKEELQGEDLGLYVGEELGEIIDYEIAFLKEVQENEKEKGQTLVQETTKYTGLIGMVLDTKTKELPGYEPVVKPVVIEKHHFREDSMDLTGGTSDESEGDESRGIPRESEGDYDDYVGDPEAGDYPPDSYYYQWMIDNCLTNSGYWYNDTCNIEAENSSNTGTTHESEDGSTNEETSDESSENENLGNLDESQENSNTGSPDESQGDTTYEKISEESYENSPSIFTCDTDHPTLCDAQEICEDMNLYWYNDQCNIESEDVVTEDLESSESSEFEISENSSAGN